METSTRKKGNFVKQVIDKSNWNDTVSLISSILDQDVDELEVISAIENEDDIIYRVRSIFRQEFKLILDEGEFQTNDNAVLEAFFGSKNAKLETQYLKTHMTNLGKYSTDIIFSQDQQFVLKKIPKGHFAAFKDTSLGMNCVQTIFKKRNTPTMRILGVFQFEDVTASSMIQTYGFSYYILIENLLNSWNFADHKLLAVYDLKGSNFGRQNKESDSDDTSDEDEKRKKKQFQAKQSNQQQQQQQQQLPESFEEIQFGKDNDLKECSRDCSVISKIDEQTKLDLYRAIQEETKYFEAANIMDYSLIVLIGSAKQANPSQNKGKELLATSNRNKFREILVDNENGIPNVISFGIIDFLSPYDFGRALETTFKSFFFSISSSTKISCVEPNTYRERFLSYVKNDLLQLSSEKQPK